jgi:hypothetical protein
LEIKIRRSNVTGIAFLSTELGLSGWVLLKEHGPGATRCAALVNLNSPANQTIAADLRAAAAAIGKQVEIFTATNARPRDRHVAQVRATGTVVRLITCCGCSFRHRHRDRPILSSNLLMLSQIAGVRWVFNRTRP